MGVSRIFSRVKNPDFQIPKRFLIAWCIIPSAAEIEYGAIKPSPKRFCEAIPGFLQENLALRAEITVGGVYNVGIKILWNYSNDVKLQL